MTDWGEAIPRLQRFYGGHIDWLNIPYKIVNAYAAMIPILEAEEQLAQITAIGVGTATVEKEKRVSIMRKLNEQAAGRKEKQALNTTAKLMQLSSMGIGIVDMRKKKT